MWKRLATIAAFASALAAGPALAQQSPTGQADPPAPGEQQPMQSDQLQPDRDAAASGLVGQDVWSSDGEEIGEVAKVNQGSGGEAESIHVNVGSTLGIGGKTVKIRKDQFSRTEDGVKLSLTAEAAEALPEAKSE